MIKKLFLIVLLFSLATANIYVISLEYSNEELTSKGVFVAEGNVSVMLEPEKGYTLAIEDEEQSILKTQKFNAPTFTIIEDFENNQTLGNIVKITDKSFALIAPYYENAHYLKIFNKQNKEIMKIDVSRFKEITKKRTITKDELPIPGLIIAIVLLAIIGFGAYYYKTKQKT